MGHDSVSESPPVKTAMLVFLPFAAGYFLSYVYRTVNAVISPDLVSEFGNSDRRAVVASNPRDSARDIARVAIMS